MIDVYTKLKKQKQKQGEFVSEIIVNVTEKEFKVFQKKAEALGMELGALAREYLLDASAFVRVTSLRKSKKIEENK